MSINEIQAKSFSLSYSKDVICAMIQAGLLTDKDNVKEKYINLATIGYVWMKTVDNELLRKDTCNGSRETQNKGTVRETEDK